MRGGTLDTCTAEQDTSSTVQFEGRALYARNTTLPKFPRTQQRVFTFSESLDDLGILQALSKGRSSKAFADPVARDAADALDIPSTAFWTRLLLHPSPEVRQLAAAKVAPKVKQSVIDLDQAFILVDLPELPPEAALSILSAGEAARARLQTIATEGTADAKLNATALLRLLDVQPPIPEGLLYQDLLPPP